MAQALTVRITATDDASAVFEAVASSAEAAGSSIESAGAGAETFGQAMETASSSAESAGAGIESAASSAETAGAAMEAAGSGAESAGSALESAGGSADVAGSAFESVGGSADAAGSSMESISSSADAVGSALESAGGHAESAGSSLESAASSAESAGAAMEAAGSGAQTAGSALESAASGAESAGSSIESAASSAESAGSAFEGAASSAESAGSGIESAGSSAESAGSAFESAGGSAESAGAAFESVGGSAESAGGALESAGASAESVASSLSNAGASADSAASSFDTLGGALNSISTRGLAAVGMTTGLVAGLTGVARSAWDQVDATQQATSALQAYETQAGQVDQIQRRLLEFARSAESGGIFFTEELYAAAQGLVTYGAEMSRVTDYVEIMARAVGQGTANWEHLVQVIGRVGSTSRLTGQDLQLLTTMGYQLDDSLRNTNMTFDELFSHLERGIPADVLEGQVNTIRGALAWLEGAVRDVGAAFLQVDRDTGTFVDGGLGDRLFQSLSSAREALLAVVPAAEAAGSAITFLLDVGGSVAGAVQSMVGAFQSLPDSVQTSALGILAFSTGLTAAGGAIRVLVPAVTALSTAFRTLATAGLVGLSTQLTALGPAIRGVSTAMSGLTAGGILTSVASGFRALGSGAAGGAIGGAARQLLTLGGRIHPVVGGLTALVGLAAPSVKGWLDQRAAAKEYESALEQLGDTIEMFRRQGEGDLAQLAEETRDWARNLDQEVNDVLNSIREADFMEALEIRSPELIDAAQVYFDALTSGVDNVEAEFLRIREAQLEAAGLDEVQAHMQAMEEWGRLGVEVAAGLEEAFEFELPQEELNQYLDTLYEALADPNIDFSAWSDWSTGLVQEAIQAGDGVEDTTARILAAFAEVNGVELSEFSIHVDADEAVQDISELKEAIDGLDERQRSFQWDMADLRLEGADDLVRDLERLDSLFIDTFGPDSVWEKNITQPPPDGMGILQAHSRTIREIGDDTEISSAQVELYNDAWSNLMAGVEDGSLSFARVYPELHRLNTEFTNGTIGGQEYIAGVVEMVARKDEYAASATEATGATDAFTAAQEMLAGGMEGVSEGVLEQRELMQELSDARQEFLADGANILDWWQEYESVLEQSGTASSTAADGFGELVSQVQDLEQAAQGLDTMLYYFDQIEALGARSSSAGAIADALFGPDGDPYDGIGPLRDIFDEGRIKKEEFDAAVQAGIAIQEADAEIQSHLNVIRAQQIPLLAEQQSNYERHIESLTHLTAEEQQHALALLDTGMQAQIAEQYSRAYAASMGEIPEEVATEMIVNAARADPVMAGLLEQMGLIEEVMGPDGEMTYSVNFPDADTTINAIDRLTIAFLEMQAVAQGMTGFDLAVEIYGQEEAEALYGMMDERDGSTSTAVLDADVTSAQTAIGEIDAELNTLTLEGGRVIELEGDGSQALEVINNVEDGLTTLVQLADGTVIEVGAEVDTSGWPEMTSKELGEMLAPDGAEVKSTVAPPTVSSVEEFNEQWRGSLPAIEVDVEGNPEPLITQLPNVGAGQTVPVGLEGSDLDVTQIGDETVHVYTETSDLDTSQVQGETVDVSGNATDLDTTGIDDQSIGVRVNPIMEAAGTIWDTVSGWLGIGDTQDETITVTTELVDNASEPLGRFSSLVDFIDGSTATVTADLTDNASTGLGEISADHSALDGSVSTLTVDLTDNATAGMEEASSYHSGLNENTSTFVLELTDNAIGPMRDTVGEHADLDGNTSILNINADTSDAQTGINWAQGFQGSILSTSYIDIVTRRSTVNVGGRTPFQHGGVVPSYASGGVIAELAEAGPELVYYPDGDVGLATQRGLYDVAPGSYVSNAAATRSRLSNGGSFEVAGAMGMGGVTVNVNVSGDVYGISDLTSKISDELVPVITEIFHDRHRGQGVN